MALGSWPAPRTMPYASGPIRIRHAIPRALKPASLHGDMRFMGALLSFRFKKPLRANVFGLAPLWLLGNANAPKRASVPAFASAPAPSCLHSFPNPHLLQLPLRRSRTAPAPDHVPEPGPNPNPSPQAVRERERARRKAAIGRFVRNCYKLPINAYLSTGKNPWSEYAFLPSADFKYATNLFDSS